MGRPSSKLGETLGTIITLSPPIGVFKLLFNTFNRNNGVSGKQSQPTSLVTLFLMNRNPIVFHPLTIKVAQRPHGFFGMESCAVSSNRPFFDLEAQRREAMRAQRATPGPLGFRKVRGSSDRNIRGQPQPDECIRLVYGRDPRKPVSETLVRHIFMLI